MAATLHDYVNEFNAYLSGPVDAPKNFRLVYYWPGDSTLEKRRIPCDNYDLLYQSTINPDVFIAFDTPSVSVSVYTHKTLAAWRHYMTTKFVLAMIVSDVDDDEYDQWIEDLQFTTENI